MDSSLWPCSQPGSPSSPAKQATQACIDAPTEFALCGVAAACQASEYAYADVKCTLADNLDGPTSDWRRLRNALWLIEHLLSCTPQLMDDLCAEPGLLRQLLGFWAEDEQGNDLGEEVRMRASMLLGQLELHEQMQLERDGIRCIRQDSFPELSSPTNSEDSETGIFSPFSGAGLNGCSHKPASSGFSLPSLSLKLPKLRLGRSPSPAPAAAAAKPPRILSSNARHGSRSLAPIGKQAGVGKAGSLGGKSGSLSLHAVGTQGSKELVAAWGNIRGQNSTDFARMLQLLDDQCFDTAQEVFEASQLHSSEPLSACAFSS